MPRLIKYILPLLLAVTNCFAQSSKERFRQYYDYTWQVCDSASAHYYCTAVKLKDGWHRTDYFLNKRSIQMEGVFADDSFKVRNGPFRWYHRSGKLREVSNFVKNDYDGLILRYHENGRLMDSLFFEGGRALYSYSWFPDGKPRTRIVYDSAHSMSGGAEYYRNGRVSSEAKYVPDSKLIVWSFYDTAGILSQRRRLSLAIDSLDCYDEKGRQQKGQCEFFMGNENIGADPEQVIAAEMAKAPVPKIKNGQRIEIPVYFRHDEKGEIKDVKILGNVDADLGKAFVAALCLNKSTPFILHNRPVSTYSIAVFSFEKKDNKLAMGKTLVINADTQEIFCTCL